MLIQTQNTNLGYLLLDHRNSPELPPGVVSPLVEASTFTCSHCQTVVIMNPQRTRERAYCRGCSHLLCDPCGAVRAQTGKCKTFKQVVDEILAEAEKQAESDSSVLLQI
jgi:hypothetical protein